MNNIGKTFSFFFTRYTNKTLLVVTLLLMSGIAEAFGVAAFLPFLQIFIDGKKVLDHVPYEPLDQFLTAHNITLNFTTVSLFIVSAILAKALILWLAMRQVSKIVADIATTFRNKYLNALLQANWPFLAVHSLGKSLNSISTETVRASQTFISNTQFLAAIIQCSVYIVGAFLVSWQVCLGILGVGTIMASILWIFIRIARDAGARQTETIKLMLARMGDIMQGIKPLRAMALEKSFFAHLLDYSRTLQKAQFDQLLSSQSLRIFHEPLMVISAISGILVIITIGDLSGSTLILLMIFFVRIMSGLSNAQSAYQRLSKEESALWSLVETIDETARAAEKSAGTDTPPATIDNITFENVNFAHKKDTLILKNASLTLTKGQFTVLVGPSGSGKTTILDLISRFYPVESGRIDVNGTPLSRFATESWRKKIGFVPQDVFLFNDSVFNNVVMGRENVSDHDVNEALAAAGAQDFVDAMPNGLHSPVGENGRRLSGGQKQRLAIARAIIHKPEILLLDEATSALDGTTEKELLDTFRALTANMMVIMASHSDSATSHADQVIRLDKGVITNHA